MTTVIEAAGACLYVKIWSDTTSNGGAQTRDGRNC